MSQSSRDDTVNRKGVDVLFGTRQDGISESRSVRKAEPPSTRKTESPNVRKAEKEKDAFYLLSSTIDTIETLRQALRREHGLSRRAASKSSVVDAAIHLIANQSAALAAWLKDHSTAD